MLGLRTKKQQNLVSSAVNQFVGETGFEPATSNSRSWRANRTALHPEIATAKIRKIILNYQIILVLMSKKITPRP